MDNIYTHLFLFCCLQLPRENNSANNLSDTITAPVRHMKVLHSDQVAYRVNRTNSEFGVNVCIVSRKKTKLLIQSNDNVHNQQQKCHHVVTTTSPVDIYTFGFLQLLPVKCTKKQPDKTKICHHSKYTGRSKKGGTPVLILC